LALAFTDLVAGASLGNLLQQFDLRQIRQLSLVWGALVSVLVCVVLFAFGKLGFTETALLALACWLNGAVSFLQQALLCKQQYAKYNMANLLPAFLVALFCAVFAFSGLLSTSSYLVALCLGWMATAWRAFGWLGEPTVSPNRAHFKLLLRSGLGFAVPNQVAHLLGLLNGRLPYFFVSAAAYVVTPIKAVSSFISLRWMPAAGSRSRRPWLMACSRLMSWACNSLMRSKNCR
jgi:hypothetical protein